MGEGVAQGGFTCGGGVTGQTAGCARNGVDHCLLDESRRRVLGLTHTQTDMRQGRVRRDIGKELTQALKRVGLQKGKK